MGALLVRNAVAFDLERLAAGDALRPVDVLAVDGTITEVGAVSPPPDAEVLDAAGRVVVPGLVNAHTHSNQTLEAALCDRLPLDAWMVLASYGGAGAEYSPRELRVSALLGAVQMLKTGCTAIVDCARVSPSVFDQGMDAIAHAYAEVGMRAAVAPQYTDLDYFSSIPLWLVGRSSPIPEQPSVDDVLAPAASFVRRWQGRCALVQPYLCPSSLPRCSVELFEASVDAARALGCGLQTHLLSARSQVEVGTRRYGGSTVDFLDRVGALEPWASFAHAIWLSDEEVRTFADHAAVAVHNPVSNLKLGAGIAPVPALLAAGATVAIGSDGASSNDTQNMFETLKMSALVHRVAGPPATWPSAADALRMCWRGGAAVLREPVGRIAAGHRADLVVLAEHRFAPGPAPQLANQLVYAELGASVDTVVVGGKIVVRHGRMASIDEDALWAEAREVIDRLWAGLPQRLRRFEELRPMLEELEAAVGAVPLAFARCCG